MSTAPAEVIALADARAQARADKDFALSDELRDAIAAAGWLIKDSADGYVLSERPPFEVAATLAYARSVSLSMAGPTTCAHVLMRCSNTPPKALS